MFFNDEDNIVINGTYYFNIVFEDINNNMNELVEAANNLNKNVIVSIENELLKLPAVIYKVTISEK